MSPDSALLVPQIYSANLTQVKGRAFPLSLKMNVCRVPRLSIRESVAKDQGEDACKCCRGSFRFFRYLRRAPSLTKTKPILSKRERKASKMRSQLSGSLFSSVFISLSFISVMSIWDRFLIQISEYHHDFSGLVNKA